MTLNAAMIKEESNSFFFFYCMKALRYPYFQVGQALGPPAQAIEQKKAVNKPAQSIESQPLSKIKKQSSSPPDVPEKTSNDSPAPHRTLQQIQLSQNTADNQLPSKHPQVTLPNISKAISPVSN